MFEQVKFDVRGGFFFSLFLAQRTLPEQPQVRVQTDCQPGLSLVYDGLLDESDRSPVLSRS